MECTVVQIKDIRSDKRSLLKEARGTLKEDYFNYLWLKKPSILQVEFNKYSRERHCEII